MVAWKGEVGLTSSRTATRKPPSMGTYRTARADSIPGFAKPSSRPLCTSSTCPATTLKRGDTEGLVLGSEGSVEEDGPGAGREEPDHSKGVVEVEETGLGVEEE